MDRAAAFRLLYPEREPDDDTNDNAFPADLDYAATGRSHRYTSNDPLFQI
jgi:hypothetical protein